MTQSFQVRWPGGITRSADTIGTWRHRMLTSLGNVGTMRDLQAFWDLNAPERQRIAALDSETATSVQMAYDAAVKRLAKPADGEGLL